MDCDIFVLSIKIENIINDLKNLEYLFDFSNLDKHHEESIKKQKTGW